VHGLGPPCGEPAARKTLCIIDAVYLPANSRDEALSTSYAAHLDNGLQVLVQDSCALGVVLVIGRLTGRIPGSDRRLALGRAHKLKGTREDEFKQVIERSGGFWNGYTWIDQTTYVSTATRDAFDQTLTLEAEQMDGGLYAPEAFEVELASAKQYHAGAMPRSLETNAGIARFLHTNEQFGLELDYDLRLTELVDAVTLDDEADAARAALAADRAVIAIAEPYEDPP